MKERDYFIFTNQDFNIILLPYKTNQLESRFHRIPNYRIPNERISISVCSDFVRDFDELDVGDGPAHDADQVSNSGFRHLQVVAQSVFRRHRSLPR